jgi:uncharacterized membrane protein
MSNTNNDVWIRDVVLNPENEVIAGRALVASVRVKNLGTKKEDGIKVNVAIPDLGVSATDYIDSLDEDQSTTSEQLFMRIPLCAKKGSYNVITTIYFKDGDKSTTAKRSINVVEDSSCTEATGIGTGNGNLPTAAISATSTYQEVQIGAAGGVYPITMTNNAGTSKTFTVNVDAGSWAVTRVSPSNTVLLQPGQTSTVYVYVAATQVATLGEQIFSVTVKSGSDTLQQIPMKANIVKGSAASGDVTNTLEMVLIVLVVLLVIIGLIVGFKKMQDKGSEDVSGEPYY